jgi:hypothetical protein
MEINMRGNGKMIRFVEKGNLFGLMGISTMANGRTTRDMEMALPLKRTNVTFSYLFFINL